MAGRGARKSSPSCMLFLTVPRKSQTVSLIIVNNRGIGNLGYNVPYSPVLLAHKRKKYLKIKSPSNLDILTFQTHMQI